MGATSVHDGPMLEALLGQMSARMASEARSIRALFAVHGREPREAALEVVELYSPPRATRELNSHSLGRRYPVSGPGSTFDLQADEP
eukprot:10381731-Alexandrium_andersonii.AAC.1